MEEIGLNVGKIKKKYASSEEWFPFTIYQDEMPFVADDDASNFVSTENFSERMIRNADDILQQLVADLCGVGD